MALRDRLGFAVLFISHDLSLLVEVADSIAVMYAGRLVERAAATAIFRAPRHPYSLGLLSSFPALHGPRRAGRRDRRLWITLGRRRPPVDNQVPLSAAWCNSASR